jgi:hypothetical protein
MGTVQKTQRSIKRHKTPEKNFPTLSFVYRSSSKDWSVSLFFTVRGADFLEACPRPWACSVQREVFWAPGLESQE